MFKAVNRIKNKKSGFTLIELVIVIAILGILAAILVPSIMGYIDEARESKNQANARQLYEAAQLAYTDLTKNGTTIVAGTYGTDDEAEPKNGDFVNAIKANLGAMLGENDTFSVTVGLVNGRNGISSVSITVNGDTYGYPVEPEGADVTEPEEL